MSKITNENVGTTANKAKNNRLRSDSNKRKKTPSKNVGGRKRWRKGGMRLNRLLSHKEHGKQVEIDFFMYWVSYPYPGRLDYKTCKQIYKKIQNADDFPTPDIFLGIVRYLQENKWPQQVPGNPDYVPELSKFLSEAEWKSIGDEKMAEISTILLQRMQRCCFVGC